MGNWPPASSLKYYVKYPSRPLFSQIVYEQHSELSRRNFVAILLRNCVYCTRNTLLDVITVADLFARRRKICGEVLQDLFVARFGVIWVLMGTFWVTADPLKGEGAEGYAGVYEVGERVGVQGEAFLCTVIWAESTFGKKTVI